MQHSGARPEIETNQRYWQLTAVQVTGATSLPVLTSSLQLTHAYGTVPSIIILCGGSLLLWIVGYLIVSMSAHQRKNTLENAETFLGRPGAYGVAITLVLSTLAWFVLQTNAASTALLPIFQWAPGSHTNHFVQVGAALGILSTLICVSGMVGIRRTTSLAFPVLAIAFFLVLIFAPARHSNTVQSLHPVFGSLAITLGTNLSVTVDFPTFFRHSKSRKDSVIAITIIQLINIGIGIGGILLAIRSGSIENLTSGLITENRILLMASLGTLIALSCLCVNAVNVYSASVGWEIIAPIFSGKKEYMILGLLLTTAFVVITHLFPIHILLIGTDLALSMLCLCLISAYFGMRVARTAPTSSTHLISFLVWIAGTAVVLVAVFIQTPPNLIVLFLGALFTLCAAFVTYWISGIKNIRRHQ